MKTSTKFNFKTLTVLILSLVLCCSLAFTAACSSGETSSSSSSTEDETVYPSDVQTITNGDFEFSTFKTEAKNFPVSSSIGWTLTRDSYNSSYAPTSKYSSGIIDTDETAYAAIAESAGFKKDGDVYYNPGTPYSYSLVDYPFVETNEDGELDNEDKLPMKGSKILMIHNETSDEGEGTAQKFTSGSTLSLTKGTYGKISLWVKTYALKTAYDVKNYGAYVAIENTVSSSLSPVMIKNINTNGEWVKYTIYLRANELADSSFKVVLGLGSGSGKFKNQYVEGFAYFDDVTFTEITAEDYNASGASKTFSLFTKDGENASDDDLVLNADNSVLSNADKKFSDKKYAISHVGGAYTSQSFNATETSGKADDKGETSVSAAVNKINSSKFAGDEALVAPVTSGSAIYAVKNNAETNTVGDFEYTTGEFSVDAGEYYAYSFFAKSYLDMTSRTGLSITVNDLGASGVSVKKSTTSLVSDLCTNDYENEQYKNWQKYTVLVSNTVDLSTDSPKARNFSLTFTFGEDGADNWTKAKGYFVIAGLESKRLTEAEYNFANTTNAVKVSLTADLPNGVAGDETSNDSYGFTYSSVDALNIKNGVASNVLSYTGVVGNSKAVGGANDNVYSDDNVLAGVINTDGLTDSNKAGLTSAQVAEIEKLGKTGDNKHLQPLMINNLTAASYGFYGNSATLSANTVTLYSVKVKTFGNAKAYVYLADANALDGFNVLSVKADQYTHDGVTVNSVDKPFAVEVGSGYQEKTNDGWYVVYIAVATGNQSKNVRIELWNGSRDGSVKSQGVVLFDSVSSSSIDLDTFKAKLDVSYGDTDDTATKTNYTRKPTKVLKDDDNGSLTYELTGKKYSESTLTYEQEAVYTVYKNSGAVIGSFETIDAVDEIDNRTLGSVSDDSSDDDSSDEEEETDDAGFSWALQITSIIIAAVLIVLLIVVLIRMLVKKSGKNRTVTKTYYNRDSRDKATEKAIAKNAKQKAIKAKEGPVTEDEPEEQPEVKPYDYDNMENNLEPEQTDDVEEVSGDADTEAPADNEATADDANDNAETPADNADAPADGNDAE